MGGHLLPGVRGLHVLHRAEHLPRHPERRVHDGETNHVWEELDKRKPLSLREKFEVRKAMWRERRNLKYIKKLKAEKVKAAKKAKKEFEKKTKEKSLMTKIGHRKRKERKQKEEAEADGDAKQTRTQRLLNRAKARPH